MDIKEAAKLINELRNSTEYMEIYGGASNEPMNVAMEIAVDSMQKQEAMKPLTNYSEYTCPMCEITISKSDDYCWHCGQKLDWSEE